MASSLEPGSLRQRQQDRTTPRPASFAVSSLVRNIWNGYSNREPADHVEGITAVNSGLSPSRLVGLRRSTLPLSGQTANRRYCPCTDIVRGRPSGQAHRSRRTSSVHFTTPRCGRIISKRVLVERSLNDKALLTSLTLKSRSAPEYHDAVQHGKPAWGGGGLRRGALRRTGTPAPHPPEDGHYLAQLARYEQTTDGTLAPPERSRPSVPGMRLRQWWGRHAVQTRNASMRWRLQRRAVVIIAPVVAK